MEMKVNVFYIDMKSRTYAVKLVDSPNALKTKRR